MSEIKIDTSRTNTTTHRAVLRSAEIKRLVWEEVCRQAGVDPLDASVGVRVELSSRSGGDIEALATITVHHETSGEVAGE
ncbi:hypothetical protein VSR34_01075 [Paraburkholderia sp. JHI2823]|uniref:hypothetical protein n=1 Tax=Paraburkholderia sp. JHI2823 TaxID=3112960 RepID=UPI00317F95DB